MTIPTQAEFMFYEAQMKRSSGGQIRRQQVHFTGLLVVVLSIVSAGCSHQMPSKGAATKIATEVSSAACLDEARKVVGPDAEVVKCGRLTGDSSLVAVAVAKLGPVKGKETAKNKKDVDGGVNVSRLVILRELGAEWRAELDVSSQIRNPSGYVATEYINDSEVSYGYRAFIRDQRPDQPLGLTIEVISLDRNGQWEGSPVEIRWNPAVGRFQEFAANEEPEGFRSEIKNPPHRKSPCTQATADCGTPPAPTTR